MSSSSSSSVSVSLASNEEDVDNRELEQAIIKYITFSKRILYVEQPATWHRFHTSNAVNLERFADYTPHQLCQKFMENVLPCIYQYDLRTQEVAAIELLQLHPEYQRSEHGYIRVDKPQRLMAAREPKLNVDYRVEEHTFCPPVSPPRRASQFTLQPRPCSSIHTVVTRYARQVQTFGNTFNFKKESHALLSAAFGDDLELTRCILLEPTELLRRMRHAKREFENKAKIPRNCVKPQKLLQKLKRSNKLLRTLCDMMDNSYM